MSSTVPERWRMRTWKPCSCCGGTRRLRDISACDQYDCRSATTGRRPVRLARVCELEGKPAEGRCSRDEDQKPFHVSSRYLGGYLFRVISELIASRTRSPSPARSQAARQMLVSRRPPHALMAVLRALGSRANMAPPSTGEEQVWLYPLPRATSLCVCSPSATHQRPPMHMPLCVRTPPRRHRGAYQMLKHRAGFTARRAPAVHRP